MTLTLTDPIEGIGTSPSPPLAARTRAAQHAANPLLEAARVLLQALADTPKVLDAPAIARRHQWLEHEVRMFVKVCSELRLRPEHVKTASYCLCAALDEAAMQTSWGRGDSTGIEWQANGLAVTSGHDRQGGDRVFRLIEEALRDPREHLDLIEVFQNMLDLGFRGRYRVEAGGRERLQALRDEVHEVVMSGGLCADHASHSARLPRQPIDPWVRASAARRSRRRIVIGLAFAAMLGAAAYAAVDHWVRERHEQRALSAPERLSRNLKAHLGDEIAAGNVELERDTNAGRNELTLRFPGMFAPGDTTVAPWGASLVAAVGREIAASAAGASVLVAGYADNMQASTTRQRSNQALSEARARQVAHILVAAGVPAHRINVSGKGDAEPLADNGTVQGRAKNRRVEVIVLE